MLKTFLQRTAVLLASAASFFLAKGYSGLTPDVISKLSRTMFGYNHHAFESLTRRSADTMIGLRLLIISLIFQIIYLLWPLTIDDIGDVNGRGILLSIGFCIIVTIVGHNCSQKLYNKYANDSLNIIKN